jgi:uncharacterized membrane protein
LQNLERGHGIDRRNTGRHRDDSRYRDERPYGDDRAYRDERPYGDDRAYRDGRAYREDRQYRDEPRYRDGAVPETVARRQRPATVAGAGHRQRPGPNVSAHSDQETEPTWKALSGYGIALAAIAVLTPLDRVWAAQVLLLPALLVVPGAILLRALRVPSQIISSFPVYVPCASIIVLLGVGLATDLAGPLVGVHAPLRTWPLLLSLEAACIVLLATTSRGRSNVGVPWQSLHLRVGVIWPTVLPLAAVLGAQRLNNGLGSAVAVIALTACIVTLVAATVQSARVDSTVLAMILYSVGLAMMWSFSLRGDLVYGFDISTEYQRMTQTVLTGIWHAGHHGDAYGAMLSVTVLPAELHFLTGMSGLIVLKVVYPMIGALFPVAIFGLARAVLSRRWAFLAPAFTLTQAAFFQELPGLARQTIGLVLFSGLVAVVIDRRFARRQQWGMIALFAAGMTVSHYSTTYIAIMIFGAAMVAQFAISWFRPIGHITGSLGVAFVAALAGAALWYGLITDSAAGLTSLAQTIGSQGLGLVPSRSSGESLFAAYFQNGTPTMSAQKYADLVHIQYVLKRNTTITPLLDASAPQYNLRAAAAPAPPIRFHVIYSGVSLGSLLVQELINLLSVCGALLLVLRRKTSGIARHVGLLGLAAGTLLLLLKVSGTLAVAYNQDRALLQALMLSAVTTAYILEWLPGRRNLLVTWVRVAIAAGLAVFFINTSGLVGALLGGGTDTNLANSGEDFERYYMTKPELVAASWLGKQVSPGQLVYADRYAQLRLNAMTGIPDWSIIGDVTPLTINAHAWIYASTANVVDGRARAYFDDKYVNYAFPSAFLDGNFDLVYTNGSSEVFHR